MKDGRSLCRTTDMAPSYCISPRSCPTDKLRLSAIFIAVEMEGTDMPLSTLDRKLLVRPDFPARASSVMLRCLRRKDMRSARETLFVAALFFAARVALAGVFAMQMSPENPNSATRFEWAEFN